MDISRREFVAGLTASCLLCGCTSEEKAPQSAPATADPQSSPAPKAAEGELIAIPADCLAPGDQAHLTLPSGLMILLWKDQVGYHAVEGRCTHRRGELNYDREHNDIFCKEHGSRFFVDGAVEKPPAKVALKSYTVSIEGENLRIAERS
ncbi:MAG: Rieske (2Fe-2S) protein [Planctomycetes bacterium]|nr:Rieske (2Fe-2S) protein [Planctomycetota bacterium]